MDLLLDETAKTGKKSDIKTEGFTAQRFQHIIKRRSSQEAHINFLDVGKFELELDLDLHGSRESHIFYNDRNALAGYTLSDSDF